MRCRTGVLRGLDGVVGGLSALLAACAVEPQPPVPTGLSLSVAPLTRGVVLQEADPSIVSVEATGVSCTGVLLSASVVLTALQCVSPSALGACTSGVPQPLLDPSALTISSLSSQTSSVSVPALSIVAPAAGSPCAASLALIVLEKPFELARIRQVRSTSAAAGSRLDTLGWGATSSPALWWREHVQVTVASAGEAWLEEDSCAIRPGAVALDESTGEVVAVLTGRSGGCDSAPDVYAQVTPYNDLVATALAAGRAVASSSGMEAKPTSSVGTECVTFADCPTSVCVRNDGADFCSRACGADDLCPTRTKCQSAGASGTYCFPD